MRKIAKADFIKSTEKYSQHRVRAQKLWRKCLGVVDETMIVGRKWWPRNITSKNDYHWYLKPQITCQAEVCLQRVQIQRSIWVNKKELVKRMMMTASSISFQKYKRQLKYGNGNCNSVTK